MANPIKALAGQTAVYGMGTIVPRLLNWLMVPFYTRVLDQSTYGEVTELYSYVAFLLALLTYGMETTFFRFAQKNDSKKVLSTAQTCILISTGIFLLFYCFCYDSLADLIHYNSNQEYVLLIGLIVALDAITAIPFAMLRKLNMARRFAIIKILNVSLNIALNMLFILAIPDTALKVSQSIFGTSSTLVVWILISNVASSLLSLLLLSPQLRQMRFCLDKELLKPMLRYALPILVVSLAGMVNEVIDKILIKFLLPDQSTAMAQLGVYGANYKLAVLMTIFIQMFRYASEPFFFAQTENKNSPQLFAKVMNYFVIVGLMIFLGIILYIDLIIQILGKDFRSGMDIVPIVLMANLFYGIFFNLSIWYKLTDKTSSGAIISIIGACVTIAANFLLIPMMGYIGAAWSHFICYLVMMVISFVWGQKYFPIPYQLLRIGGYFIFAIVIFFISKELNGIDLYLKLAINTVMIIAFAVTAFLIERRNSFKAA